ncbi:outer membrane protein assembly factor BamA [Thalassospiraceae bacterium LMO-JJ14]|nr:outer membrane protein assembly factor BamA [Thalassospiraceae bacterium LMO-JJ14]
MTGLARLTAVALMTAAIGPLSSLTISASAAETVEIAQADVIQTVEVRGAQRVDPGTVRSYMVIQEGDPFDPRRIDRSLKSLFATGLFADISLRREGNTLVVNVVENPIINRIAIEGNHEFDAETIKTEISLRPRVIYTRTKIQDDVKRILTLYRQSGLFAVNVEPKIIQLEQNRVDLVFEIAEGAETAIGSIRFIGNREFSDGRLREVIQTRETTWWRFFSTDDVYDPDRMNLDRELLRRFYLANGYADFKVNTAVAELTPDKKAFFLTFAIEEGERYRFGDLEVEARLKNLNDEDLKTALEVESGDWYSADEIEKTIDRLTELVGTLGFAFVEIRPRVNRDRENKTINVKYVVNEGPRVFVERINIAGNVRTLDKVIRREFRLVEGDAFNASKLRRSKTRIQNLGFFAKVDVEQIAGDAPDKTIINVNVEEKPTGQITIGAGFSSSVGVLGDIRLRETNFLGRGQDVGVKFQLAAAASELDFSFTEPYFLDRDLSAGFDLFRTTRDLQDTSSFDIKRTGGRLRAGYEITENLSEAWRYTARLTDISNIDDDASSLIRAQEGEETLSELGHSIAYDRRDRKIKSTKGYILKLDTDLAGLGGSIRHVRNTAIAVNYYSLADQWIISTRGKVGYIAGIGEDVVLSERYFVGGDDVRGFETSGIGPRDLATDDALGGEFMYSASLALSFPSGLPDELGVTGRLFTDLGSSSTLSPTNSTTADENSLRMGVGAGITWESPFGPLGVDFAYPVLKEDFDRKEYVRINFGTKF